MTQETQPIRVELADYRWLMENRGSGSVPKKVHELIAYYCYHEGKPQSQGNRASEKEELK